MLLEKYLEEVIEEASDRAHDEEIDPLINLKNDPAYVSGCDVDYEVDQFNQLLQYEFYEHFKSHAFRVQACNKDVKKAHEPHERAIYNSLQFIMSNMEGTGINTKNKVKLEVSWESALKKGVLTKFDQDEILVEAFKEQDPDNNKYFDEDEMEDYNSRKFHQFLKWGLIYYPHVCEYAVNDKCKLQIVLHDCGVKVGTMA